MIIFLVKHYVLESYAGNNQTPIVLTQDRQKAFRFGTRELAKHCLQRMQIPVAWDIVETKIENGVVA